MRSTLAYPLFETTTTKTTVMLFLFVVVASAVCSSYATPVASPHIVGGKQWHFMLRPEVYDLNLYKNGKLMRSCKASQVSLPPLRNRWITAAECLDKYKYDKIQLKHNFPGKFEDILSSDLGGPEFHIHPEYNNKTGENNIGVILEVLNYLDKDAFLRRRLIVPYPGQKFVGETADIFLEFKNTTKEGDKEERVHVETVKTKIISSSWCALWYPWSPIKNKNVCASGWYWKGLHKDDVGIPLVVLEDDRKFRLVGIATGVRPWAHWLGLPIEFLDVQPYITWIESVDAEVIRG